MEKLTHKFLKKAVTRSFLWSLTRELAKTVGSDPKLGIMQNLAAASSTQAVLKILIKECRKDAKYVDIIEPLKMEAWDVLADRCALSGVIARPYRPINMSQGYKWTRAPQDNSGVVLNLPTALEEIFFSNFGWLSTIPNLTRNFERMIWLAVEKNVDPKVSRKLADQYEEILSGVVYRYLKSEAAE